MNTKEKYRIIFGKDFVFYFKSSLFKGDNFGHPFNGWLYTRKVHRKTGLVQFKNETKTEQAFI